MTSLNVNGAFDETRISIRARSKDEIWKYYRYVKENGLIQDR